VISVTPRITMIACPTLRMMYPVIYGSLFRSDPKPTPYLARYQFSGFINPSALAVYPPRCFDTNVPASPW